MVCVKIDARVIRCVVAWEIATTASVKIRARSIQNIAHSDPLGLFRYARVKSDSTCVVILQVKILVVV